MAVEARGLDEAETFSYTHKDGARGLRKFRENKKGVDRHEEDEDLVEESI